MLTALGRPSGRRARGDRARECLLELGAETEARAALAILDRENRDDGVLVGVTTRERQVLMLLLEGLTNRQIAKRLVVSEHTVHRHVTNTLRKLGLPSRTAAAAYAVRAGLAEPPPA